MTRDDYEQIRSQYADINDLCNRVEGADTEEASEAGLRRLIQLLTEQQRAPEQMRSFVTHLGAAEPIISRILGKPSPGSVEDSETGIA